MIEIIGLFFLGLWAAGKARQKGRNPYAWSLVPIGLYLVVYILTNWILDLSVGGSLTEAGKTSLIVVLFIKIGLIPFTFIISKYLLDAIFNRMADKEEIEQ